MSKPRPRVQKVTHYYHLLLYILIPITEIGIPEASLMLN